MTYVNTEKICQTKAGRLYRLFVSSDDTHNYTKVTITKLKGVIYEWPFSPFSGQIYQLTARCYGLTIGSFFKKYIG